jgi:hypothetical protein
MRPQSIRLEGIYAGQGYEKPHHLFTDVVQIARLYNEAAGRYETARLPYRDGHAWLNAEHGGFPDGIRHGTRVRFWCSFHNRPGGARLTDCRQVEILEVSEMAEKAENHCDRCTDECGADREKERMRAMLAGDAEPAHRHHAGRCQ